MSQNVEEFLQFLEREDDEDYGDFKREVDLHLMRLVDSMQVLTPEQVWQVRKMRELLLWTYKEDKDIPEMKTTLREAVQHLQQ